MQPEIESRLRNQRLDQLHGRDQDWFITLCHPAGDLDVCSSLDQKLGHGPVVVPENAFKILLINPPPLEKLGLKIIITI